MSRQARKIVIGVATIRNFFCILALVQEKLKSFYTTHHKCRLRCDKNNAFLFLLAAKIPPEASK
jgi:hypothetical protein